MFDAVFFDLDGTLIDTEAVALAAGLRAFAEFGHAVDASFLHGLIGKDEPTVATLIRATFPDLDEAGFSQAWQRGFREDLATGIPMKPGVVELLQAIELPKALVTSTRRQGAHWKLDRAGLTPHFRTIVTFDDVTAPKPAPAPYLLAAERLHVDPTRCLVFEDSDVGAEAAHRAGCIVVQVPDVQRTDGRFARHLADDLWSGARLAGLV